MLHRYVPLLQCALLAIVGPGCDPPQHLQLLFGERTEASAARDDAGDAEAPNEGVPPRDASPDKPEAGRVDAASKDAASADAGPTPPPARTHLVVLMTVDGLASRFVTADKTQAELPHFQRLRTEGLSTMQARCDPGSSYTMPNHTSMITGRPVSDQTKFDHQFVVNYDPGGDTTLHSFSDDNVYISSVFDEVHDRGGFAALSSGKSKFELFARSYGSVHGRLDTIGEDNGRNKLDAFEISSDSEELMNGFIARLKQGVRAGSGPNFAMYHFHDTDTAGHSYGWGSDEYLGAVRLADVLLGRLMEALESSDPLRGAILLVTADHGGSGAAHGDGSLPEVFQIPYFVWGKNMPRGDLYDHSLGSRVDPGTELTGVDGAPVRNGDSANLALSLLGVLPVRGSYYRGFEVGPP